MKTIGFINGIDEDCSKNFNPAISRTWRAVAMYKYLQTKNVEIFIYSYYNINPNTKKAFGYIVEDDKFIPQVRSVPSINGYWFHYNSRMINRSHLHGREFFQWAQDNGIYIYPAREVRQVLNDKFKLYRVVDEYGAILQPSTQIYNATQVQFNKFLRKTNKVFIKPRSGSKGNGHFVLVNNNGEYTLSLYKKKQVKTYKVYNVYEVINKINKYASNKKYIIQSGIEILPLSARPFIIRAIGLDDGMSWHFNYKVVAARLNSDVANTTQNGTNYTLDYAFKTLFGPDAELYKNELHSVCSKLINYLDGLWPKQLMEVAVDMVIDKNKQFVLLEADVFPGLKKPEMNGHEMFSNVFAPSGYEKKIYDKYFKHHGEYLAKFLLKKLNNLP